MFWFGAGDLGLVLW